MASVRDIIDQWPSAAELARDIGLSPKHGAMLRYRGSIPTRYWPAVVKKAKDRKIQGVTYEALTFAHAAPAKSEAAA